MRESDHPTTHTTCSLAWADPAVKNGEKQKGGGGKEEGSGDSEQNAVLMEFNYYTFYIMLHVTCSMLH